MTVLTATELSALVNELLPVATLDDLRELAVPDNQASITVQGGDSAGDGEGGEFFFNPDATNADDDTTYFKPDSLGAGEAGRWIRLSTFGVLEFGGTGSTVTTIALLRLLSGQSDNDRAVVLGYYAAGDGGGGEFYWSAASVASDNSGTVILPTGHSGAGRWLRVYSGALNVKWFGAKGDNSNDDTTAIQAALDVGVPVHIPKGTFKVTSSLSFHYGTHITGAGREFTTIASNIVGDSLFKPDSDSVAFVYMADMEFTGNALTGGSGSGHALALIDPTSGGSWTPQLSCFERLRITGFKGQDDADRGGVTKIAAAGVMCYQPLHCIFSDIFIGDCGHGFYMDDTQNCRILNCVADDNVKYTLFAYSNDNLIVDGCDFIDSGDGTADTGYPETGLLSGIVGSFKNSGFVLKNSKIKNNNAGTALIVQRFSNGDVIRDNWLRADALTDIAHKGIFSERCPGLVIDGNVFSPAVSNFTSRAYEQIELYNTQTAETFIATITNNTFEDVSGQNIAYNIKVGGNSSARTFQVTITGNQFGDSVSSASASTITADVFIESCAVEASILAYNLHYAVTNITRTAGVSVSGASWTNGTIGPNKFITNGGTITANYSNAVENDVMSADKANGSPTITSLSERTILYNTTLTADRTVTITTTGAASGDRKRVIRTANATGDFDLIVSYASTTLNLACGEWAELEYSGSAWTLSERSPLGREGVSADKGDAAATLTVGVSEKTQVWNTAITADRAVTLNTGAARSGDKFRIVRTASATGAFNLNVGTGPLKAMGTAGSFCEVEYNGSAWMLTAYGTL